VSSEECRGTRDEWKIVISDREQGSVKGGTEMFKPFTILALVGGLGILGCTNAQTQWLDGLEPSAMQIAASRGQSEMSCPTATPTLMSRQMAQQPGYTAPGILQSTQYTINVEGCGKQQLYFILCPLGGAECYPAAPGTFVGR